MEEKLEPIDKFEGADGLHNPDNEKIDDKVLQHFPVCCSANSIYHESHYSALGESRFQR